MSKRLIVFKDGDVIPLEFESKFVDSDGIVYFDCGFGHVIAYDEKDSSIFIPEHSDLRMKIKEIVKPVVKKNVSTA